MTSDHSNRIETPAGWYIDPNMTKTRRFWDGKKWTDSYAPLEASQGISTWKGIRIVAVGILVAVAAIWFIYGPASRAVQRTANVPIHPKIAMTPGNQGVASASSSSVADIGPG